MEILEIPNLTLTNEQLEFIYEVHKSIEMRFALTQKVLGLNKRHPTASEVRARLSINHQVKNQDNADPPGN